MADQIVTESGINHTAVMAELMEMYSMAWGIHLMTRTEGDGLAGVLSSKLAREIIDLHNRIDADAVAGTAS